MIGGMFRLRSVIGLSVLAAGLLCATACARGSSDAVSKEDAMQTTGQARTGRTIDGYTYTDAPVEARLGPHVFRFPANYYRDQMGPNFDGSFSLLVQWPDLEPLPPGERSGQDMETFDKQITIAPAYVEKVPIETRLEASTMPMASPGTLEYDDPRDRIDLMLAQPERYGLVPYVIDATKLASYAQRFEVEMGIPAGTARESYKDWFVGRDGNGRLTTVIQCDHEPLAGDDRRPGCTHDFVVASLKLRVSIDYGREYLPGWKKIEDRARELLDRHRVD